MTKLLCDIGAVVDVKEWGLAMMNIKMMSGKDRELLEMIQLQYFMSIARVNGCVFRSLRIESRREFSMSFFNGPI